LKVKGKREKEKIGGYIETLSFFDLGIVKK
jgi:hypothetical protein